jgi:hypothetical protein
LAGNAQRIVSSNRKDSAMVVVPRQAKIILLTMKAHDAVTNGAGDKYRQRRTLARWQRLDALRRAECPSLMGQRVG